MVDNNAHTPTNTANKNSTAVLDFLLSPAAIRQRAASIYSAALNGGTHFEIFESQLPATTDYVLSVIHENYPTLDVPYHSRWRHFEVGNRAQLNQYKSLTGDLDPLERARRGLDLIIPSVLVDAGAGPDWLYRSDNSEVVGRSEGLALASMDLFLAGALSHRGKTETTAQGLQSMSELSFARYFQVSDTNPLLGVPGRVSLLNQLGRVISANADVFPTGRPGDLVDFVLAKSGQTVAAGDLLQIVLKTFGDIWPGRLHLDGVNLGDTWLYPPFGDTAEAYVPFHKLSQWLSYSIIETLESNGFTVNGLNALTGLAEYRNGGLMLDSGLIRLRDPALAQQSWAPGSEIIIEWRALTVCLLDKIGQALAEKLNKTQEEFPLAKVLEGGTWAAGRKLALKNRGNLTPPLQIDSDATVF